MAARARLNAIDRLVAAIWPQAGVERLRARTVLSHYEAAKPSPQRKFRRDGSSANTLVERSAVALRNQARHLVRNHDLARGALQTLVNNTVGPQGIGIEPQPRRQDGTIHADYAAQLQELWRDFERRPEVTWLNDWQQVQRLMATGWFVDGDVFAQRLIGPVPLLDHGTRVPYSLELIEADLVPLDLSDGQRLQQGIECNAWGRPVAVHVLKGHPGDGNAAAANLSTKRVPADRMLHLARRERIGQLRGVTAFASVITRLEDLKDYEESERIAAKVAAMLTAYVKRHAPDGGGYEPATDEQGNPVQRQLGMSPGMIIDTLSVGEEIGLIDSKRPNPNLVAWRAGQLRAFAAGLGASYSSISRSYDGTFSAQRQELVEQWVHYAALTDMFVGMFVLPVWGDFVTAAHMSGVLRMPADLKPGTHDDCAFVAPSMPWIDPLKEATAWLALTQAGFASEVEVIRKRGGNPSDVLQQLAAFRRQATDLGLTLNSNAATQGGPAAAANADGSNSDTLPADAQAA